MSNLYRYDAIQLKDNASEDDFVKLMKETIMPHFKNRYMKLTRVSVCILRSQEILKDTKKEKKYIWLTTWDGRDDVISNISFKGATMSSTFDSETKGLLKQIDDFGKRKIANIYSSID